MKIETVLTREIKDASRNERAEKKGSIWSKEIAFLPTTGNNTFKARFFAELSLLISSGMDIRRSLDIIEGGTAKEKERNLLSGIKGSVVNGSSLSEALGETGRFELYDTMTLAIGEETGALSGVLDSLSVYYSKKISQRRQIIGALTYPGLVFATTIVSLVFMLNYIVPMFEDVFQRFRGELPPLTKAIIAVSDSFMNVFWVLLIIMLIITHVSLTNRNRDWFRSLKSTLSVRTPVFGEIVMLTYKVRYCQTLALLVSSRIHLLKALGMIKSVIGYYPLENDMDEIIEKISAGISLSEAMESSAFFDRKMIAMTKVGEEVNRLDTIYEQLYKQYSEDLDVRIRTMNNLLEPVLIIFVGLMVGVILVAMYLPIFQMGINIGGN